MPSPLSFLYQKMRAAKAVCKSLNRSAFSGIEKRTKEVFEVLQNIQTLLLSSPTPALFEEERRVCDSWLFLAAAEQNFFKLKARVRWNCKGDLNTGFFHKCVKANLSKNIIHFLTDANNSRVTDVQEMKNMAVQFYTLLQGRSNAAAVSPYTVAQIRSIHPFRCSAHHVELLSAIPSDEDIRNTLFSLPQDKAPRPDGFSAEFFKSSWGLVGADFTRAVKQFFLNQSMQRQTNATVISLIPKTPGASSLSDFRHISLCNTVCKVIAKLLASRLKLIAPNAVQRNQVGFVKRKLLC